MPMAYPIWAAASPTKTKKVLTIQNKFFRIYPKAHWFMRIRQTHNDTRICVNICVNIWIKTQLENFHAKLEDSDGARHYQLGRKTRNRRLRPRLLKNILITDTEELSSKDEK